MRPNDNYTQRIREFHTAFGHPLGVKEPDTNLLKLRAKLIREEAEEVSIAFREYVMKLEETDPALKDIPISEFREQLLSELADLLVVTFGAAEALNLEISPAYNRIMNANMSKLGKDGKPVLREDGKILKGTDFKPATMKGLV